MIREQLGTANGRMTMGNGEILILLGALVLAGYLTWALRAEFPVNIQIAARVLVFGGAIIAIILWWRYIDVPWYLDTLALVAPIGAFFRMGAWTIYQLGKIASDEKALVRKNLIKSEDFSNALSSFESEDYEKSVFLFEELANQGNRAAQYNLGIIYEIGVGGLRDDHRAEDWYRKAAENGLPEAQFGLATILTADYLRQTENFGYAPDTGNSTLDEREQKFLEAYKWLLLAKQAKHRNVSTALKRLGKNMTKSQIEVAQRMAENEQPRDGSKGS